MLATTKRLTTLLLVAVAVVLLAETAALACPSCKESLAHSDPARANMVRGYFWSILFMMSMPFLILGGLSTLFWWEIRKAKLAKAREALIEERELVEV